jgi:Flp pilus assembly protein TadG
VRGGDVDLDMLGVTTGNIFARRHAPASRRFDRRGAAMVEMAIVVPLLLLLTLGLIEYGWVFLRVSQINQAARHGVRTAVRPDATATNVQAAVASMMNDFGLGSSGYTLTYTNLAVPVGQPVTVHISVNYSQLTLTGSSFVPLPDRVQGRGTMAKEGPPAGS